MGKTQNPSHPHKSKGTPARHVDINGPAGKIHQVVQNNLGATAIHGANKGSGKGK